MINTELNIIKRVLFKNKNYLGGYKMALEASPNDWTLALRILKIRLALKI
jgi:hypothetical protein